MQILFHSFLSSVTTLCLIASPTTFLNAGVFLKFVRVQIRPVYLVLDSKQSWASETCFSKFFRHKVQRLDFSQYVT